MVDEILSTFLDELWAAYDARPRGRARRARHPGGPRHRVVPVDRPAPRRRRDLPERVQAPGDQSERFRVPHRVAAQVREDVAEPAGARGRGSGAFRADLDVRLIYRFVRDTVWVAAVWYRPGGQHRPTRSPGSTCHGPERDRRSPSRARTPEHHASPDHARHLEGVTMAEAYIVEAVRTPVGRRGGGLAGVHPADLGAHVLTRADGAHGRRPGRRRGRRLRLPRHRRPAGRRHRPHLLAGRRAARGGAGRHRRPAVRLLAAGRALRRAGRAVRHPGPGRRGRRAEHVADPDRLRRPTAAEPLGFTEGPFAGSRGLAGAATATPEVSPVPRRRDDRRESGTSPARRWRSSRYESHQRAHPRHRRGPLRARDRPLRGRHRRRGPAPRHHPGEDGRR